MDNNDRIEIFRDQIKRTLIPLINKDYALLDVPNHGNIGDNLIWEGEVQFLKESGHKCLYSANVLNWDENRIKDIPLILFHGGGNWGDLYRMCQDHRLYVISKYKDKQIVVFPQTAWYNDESLLESDCKIINEHPSVVVCLRDQESYNLLAKYIDHSRLRLIPDMAFCVELRSNKVVPHRTLYLNRTDTEQKESRDIPFNCYVTDWPTYPNNKLLYRIWHICFVKKNLLSVKLQKRRMTSWIVDPEYGLNRKNSRERYIKKGINLYSKFDIIYTTRLHGLILGILMKKTIYIVDNKYNKCKNFYNTWLKDFDNLFFV